MFPPATAAPAFIWEARPHGAVRTRSASVPATRAVSSALPPSTTIISNRPARFWRRRMKPSINRASFRTGTMTEICGTPDSTGQSRAEPRTIQKKVKKLRSLATDDAIERPAQAEQIDRLRKIHVEPRLVPAILIRCGEIAAHSDGCQVRTALTRFSDKLIAVPIRQADIAEHDLHFIFIETFQSARHGIAGANLMAPAAQDSRKRLPGVIMIFDKQNSAHDLRPATNGLASYRN